MSSKTILILGGSGNTGRVLARLLLQETDASIVLAGRNLDKAILYARTLNQDHPGYRVRVTELDAASSEGLDRSFAGVDLVVVASSTTQYIQQIATAALNAGADYIDLQYSLKKIATLRSMEGAIRQAGRCFITDGGFHPGLPAFMVRYTAQFFDQLECARVGSVIKQDWKSMQIGAESVCELVELINDYEMLIYKAGQWVKVGVLSISDLIHMDFGDVFGKQYCAPMMLEEMRQLPGIYPGLTDTGFYVGSFNWFVDWVIMPIAMLSMKVSPRAALNPMGRWMHWGLKAFSKPPYGTLLRVEATGKKDGSSKDIAVTISHADGYTFTAIPVVACILQYLDGSAKNPGLWFQALVVEPIRFMRDMQRMGIMATIA